MDQFDELNITDDNNNTVNFDDVVDDTCLTNMNDLCMVDISDLLDADELIMLRDNYTEKVKNAFVNINNSNVTIGNYKQFNKKPYTKEYMTEQINKLGSRIPSYQSKVGINDDPSKIVEEYNNVRLEFIKTINPPEISQINDMPDNPKYNKIVKCLMSGLQPNYEPIVGGLTGDIINFIASPLNNNMAISGHTDPGNNYHGITISKMDGVDEYEAIINKLVNDHEKMADKIDDDKYEAMVDKLVNDEKN